MNNVVHNKFEAICLVKALDFDNDGCLGYSDFLNIVNYKSHKSSTDSNVIVSNKIGVDVEYAFARLLERELEMHRKLEAMKAELAEDHQICMQEAYFLILPTPCAKKGFTYKNLKNYLLEGCSFDILEEEIRAVMNRLDRDQDGLVS